MLKKLICTLTAALMLTTVGVGRSAAPSEVSASVSASSDSGPAGAALWLAERLGNRYGTAFRAEGSAVYSANAEIILSVGADSSSAGADLTSLSDEGYLIRRLSGSSETFILARTNAGLDRAVRYFANYLPLEGEVNHVSGEGYRVGSITVAGREISEYVILNTAPEDSRTVYAAELLQKYLGDACGVYPPIVSEADSDSFAITLVCDADGDEYGDESFSIKSHENGITITGGRFRGCIYGVYTFLEDYIGYRFYYKYGTVPNKGDYGIPYLYEAEALEIGASDIDRREDGSFVSRCAYSGAPYFSPALKYNGGMYDEPGNDDIYSHIYGTYGVAANACHGFKNYIPEDEIVNYDPDYVRGVNPCFTDEALFDELYSRVIADLDRRVEMGMTPGMERYMCAVDIAQLDIQSFCMCEDCVAVYSETGAVSGAVITHANKMAEALEDTPYSELFVNCFAYYGTATPPENIELHERVMVNFCFYISDDKDQLCMKHSVGDHDCNTNVKFSAHFERWCELCDNVYVWYYPSAWYYYANTTHDLFTMYDDIRYFRDNGIYGVMALLEDMGTGPLGFIKNYMYQRMMWDADMSREEFAEILKEFLYLTYGEGWDYVYDYLVLMDTSSHLVPGCWTGLSSAPMRKLDFSYIKENADYILNLYESALTLASDSYQEQMVHSLFKHSRYHVAAATHTDMWLEGTEEERARYKENLDAFVSMCQGTYLFFDWGGTPAMAVPYAGTFDYDVNPLEWTRTIIGSWDDDYNF